MSIYSELQEKFSSKRERDRIARLSAADFASFFASEFSKFCEFPDFYEDHGPSRNKVPYVSVLRTKTENDSYIFEDPENRFEVLNIDEDVYWLFGVRITLDSGIGHFPKLNLNTAIHFLEHDNRRVVCVTKDPKGRFELDANAKLTPVFEHIVSVIKSYLDRERIDEAEGRSIGFI